MKILYFAFAGSRLDGVTKKIIMQHKALRSVNLNTETFLLANRSPDEEMDAEIKNIEGLQVFVADKEVYGRLRSRKVRLEYIAERVLAEKPREVVVYIRYPIADYFFWDLTKKLSSYVVVTEHQQIEGDQYFTKATPVKALSELLFGGAVRKNVTGFIGVTKEILDYQIKRAQNKTKIGCVIGNGVTVNSFPLRRPPEVKYGSLRVLNLLFLGTPYHPHGLDRLIKGIASWENSRKIDIHLFVVGESHFLNSYERQVIQRGIQASVTFTGFKSGDALNQLFEECHIAVGSLGIHRKGLTETSELKAREYCARGIPFFSSSYDSDFPKDFPYRLKVPADENPIDIETIYQFAERVMSEKEHPVIMRDYAVKHLDWSVKMERLATFLCEISELKNQEN